MNLLLSGYFYVGLIITSSSSFASPATSLEVAQVSSVIGEAYLISEKSKPLLITEGQNISEFSQIVTSAQSTVTLLLKDHSEVKLGNNSKLKLDYSSKDAEHVDLILEKGTLKTLVKRRVDTRRWFKVHTPTATMGVRGTEFITLVSENKNDIIHEEVLVSHGSVQVADLKGNELAMVNIGMGLGFDARKNGASPPQIIDTYLKPQPLNPIQIQMINSEKILVSPKQSGMTPDMGKSPGHDRHGANGGPGNDGHGNGGGPGHDGHGNGDGPGHDGHGNGGGPGHDGHGNGGGPGHDDRGKSAGPGEANRGHGPSNQGLGASANRPGNNSGPTWGAPSGSPQSINKPTHWPLQSGVGNSRPPSSNDEHGERKPHSEH